MPRLGKTGPKHFQTISHCGSNLVTRAGALEMLRARNLSPRVALHRNISNLRTFHDGEVQSTNSSGAPGAYSVVPFQREDRWLMPIEQRFDAPECNGVLVSTDIDCSPIQERESVLKENPPETSRRWMQTKNNHILWRHSIVLEPSMRLTTSAMCEVDAARFKVAPNSAVSFRARASTSRPTNSARPGNRSCREALNRMQHPRAVPSAGRLRPSSTSEYARCDAYPTSIATSLCVRWADFLNLRRRQVFIRCDLSIVADANCAAMHGNIATGDISGHTSVGGTQKPPQSGGLRHHSSFCSSQVLW